MSSIDRLFNAHLVPTFAEQFGETGVAIYAPDGGDEVPLAYATIWSETTEEYQDESGIRSRQVRLLDIVTDRSHPNFSGIEKPLVDAAIVIRGANYAILETAELTWGESRLKLRRVAQRELNRPQLRRQGGNQ